MTAVPAPLDDFICPMRELPAWGVHQGYGSFLTFNFGIPELIIQESTRDGRLRRNTHLRGDWHLWIYCCHWRAFEQDEALAWSEDDRPAINRAAAILNGQKLLEIVPNKGCSTFRFDLGGRLETWPYADSPDAEQWMIMTRTETFSYRGDGLFSRHDNNTVPEDVIWLPLK
jgi:hypothetical protein